MLFFCCWVRVLFREGRRTVDAVDDETVLGLDIVGDGVESTEADEDGVRIV